MKTKNSLKLISIIIMVAIIVSCKNLLDLNPISNYNSGSFYKTQKDFELAVAGMYAPIRSLYNSTVELALESRSDNVALDVHNLDYAQTLIHMFIDNETNSLTNSFWRNYYIVIDRCNAVIDRIDNATFSDENRRSNLKGEAYFLRGYSYFQLGWLFGGVPLIDHQMTFDEIMKKPRSTQDETFSFAANDLIQAAQSLPEQWGTNEVGKATKYAAKGILARMYLFQKKYPDAKTLLSEIINSGKYQMATNYADCFSELYDNSPEHVFQVQFMTGNLGQGNSFVQYEVPQFFRSPLFPNGGSSGAMIVSYDLYNKYGSGDFRRNFNIIKGFTLSTGVTDTVTLYYIKYAHQPKPPSSNTDYEVNMPILRYTDVKMMYAECLNEEGYNPSGEAFAILNEVRTRAGIPALTFTEIPSQEAFRQAMLDERRLEFACEYMRWFDLLRSGKAMTVLNTFFQRPEEQSGTYQMKDYQTIFPIPQYELDVNPDRNVIFQNPGY